MASRAYLEAAAAGWDAAVASMRYEDGSPVELVAVMNPYRVMIEEADRD